MNILILIKILNKMAEMENMEAVADKLGDYLSYYRYFQKEFEEIDSSFVRAKDIVRALHKLKLDNEISVEVRDIIEKIFSKIDPRDYSWVCGECECETCSRKNKSELKKMLKSMGFDIIDVEKDNDKDKN